MQNSESSSFKFEYQEIQPPNVILNKIKKDNNNSEFSNIISKNIIFNNNPINMIRNDKQNIKYIKKKKNKINSKNTHSNKNQSNNNSRNNTNIYNKKKLGDGFVSSSGTSGLNSLLSYTQKNNILSNIEFIENNSNNNIENNNINNIYNIKTTNNKSTNILIKNIYSNDDYFSTNIKEGILHLKDFEIYKSNKISQFDVENKYNLEQNNKNKGRETAKPLSQFLIKTEQKRRRNNKTKSCDYINRNIKFKSSEITFDDRIFGRQLSAQFTLRNNNRNGKIINLMCLFNKNRNFQDKIIIRGTRNEKGGVVDFSTASPKKFYKKKRYLINLEAKNKNIYKYPKWKIISSAKIIQKWWKNRMITYYLYLNKIKKIQKNIKYYLLNQNKDKNSNKTKIQKLKINNNQKIGIILLKKIFQVKIANLFCYVLFNLKNSIKIEQIDNNKQDISIKYIYISQCIIEYIKNIKRKNIFEFLMNLKNIKFYNNHNLKPINESNIFIECKSNFLINKNVVDKTKEFNSYYYELNKNNFKKKIKYNEFEISKIFNLIYKILLYSIIDKIKKEADRRTIIKAFRDINKMKYPILFYSLMKLHKYTTIKYNVMNEYAILIQRCYRDFKEKKMRNRIIYY